MEFPMRYELRRWTDDSRSEYVVRQKSSDYTAINQPFNLAFFASSAPNLLHIVDTEAEHEMQD